jgi:diadenosine tetraphosphate (Ap4A) HIT family hydrolase
MSRLTIHPTLQRDCFVLGRLPACHVLLHNNASIPWLILVPETSETDLFGLEESLRCRVFAECGLVAEVVRSLFRVQRINFAQIGNIVPQLHLHVVGRSEGDGCWPAPVWGNPYPPVEYSTEQIRSLTTALQERSSGFTPAAGA